MPHAVGRPGRRVRVFLTPVDLDGIGRRLTLERPSVRFLLPGSTAVMREMPTMVGHGVRILDAVMAPRLGHPESDAWMGDVGMAVNVVASWINDDQEMRVGEITTVLDPADPEHVAFWGAVASVVKQMTKPHVTFLDGRRANIRVGEDAAAWWLADESRGFVDVTPIRYCLREPRSPI